MKFALLGIVIIWAIFVAGFFLLGLFQIVADWIIKRIKHKQQSHPT